MRNVFLLWLFLTSSVFAELIPAARLFPWQAHVNNGIPGGIPAHTVIHNVLDFGADPTGVADSIVAFGNAEDACAYGDVVYAPAGRYRWSAPYGISAGRVLRGDGPGRTIFEVHTASGIGIQTGANTGNPWHYTTDGTLITAGLSQGSTSITLADASSFNTGEIITITELNDWANIVVSSTGQGEDAHDRIRGHKTRITNKSGNVLTISPALPWTLQAGLNPHATRLPLASYTQDVGLEDFTLDCANMTGGGTGIKSWANLHSWIKNVTVVNPPNLGIFFLDSFECEVTHSYIDTGAGSGTPNHDGIQVDRSGCLLVEDNIIKATLEINVGTTCCVFAYNYVKAADTADQIGKSFDTNHAPHNSFNLFEGNVTSSFQADGYFGGDSEETFFRNYADGYSPTANQFSYCFNFNRFSRRMNVVGNIAGRASVAPFVNGYTYEATQPASYGNRYIYANGFPYIGGWGAIGTVKPSIGSWWAAFNGRPLIWHSPDVEYNAATAYTEGGVSGNRDVVHFIVDVNHVWWSAVNAAKNGLVTWDTPDVSSPDWAVLGENASFPEQDLDVESTLIRKLNFNYATNSIPAGEASADPLPNSLYRTVAPEWWTPGKPWPPFIPGVSIPQYTDIPAGERLFPMAASRQGGNRNGSVGRRIR